MKYYRLQMLLLVFACAFMISCSSDAKTEFEKVVFRVDKYLSERPILVSSKKVMKGSEDVYAYYALRIVDYDLSYNIKRTFSSVSPYQAVIRISCHILNNAKSGDLISDISAFQHEVGILSKEASGFSTTDMALHNTDFSTKSRLAFMIRYSYQSHDWIYNSIEGGPLSESFFHDLQTFSQNKEFRKAIGMRPA